MAAASQALRFNDGFPRPDKHMPGLDCLRGVAILMVILYHGLSGAPATFHDVLNRPERIFFTLNEWGGNLGVHLFFVLSGFLITGILVDSRSRPDYYKIFYARRAARILPALLLFLFVMKVGHQINWTFLLLSLFFVSNLALRYSGGPTSPVSVLWTLSVEEQFYLVWPTVVHKLRPRQTFLVAVALVALTPVIRLVLLHFPPFNDVYYKTWATLDFFGGGAIIALLLRFPRARVRLPQICLALFALSALGFLLRWIIFRRLGTPDSFPAVATFMTPWVFLFSASVLAAVLLPALAESLAGRALAFLGYISYGLYLYHLALLYFIDRHWNVDGPPSQAMLGLYLLRLFVGLVLSIALAWASRSTFEAYFLKLKPRKHETLKDVSVAV